MSVYLDKKTNTWYVQHRQFDAIANKYKTIKKRGFKRKHDAIAYEQDLQSKLANPSLLFSELVELYIESRIPYTTDETRFKKKQTILKYCEPFLNKHIADISPPMISNWCIDLVSKPISVRQKNKVIEYIKSVSTFGYEYHDLPNFAKFLKPIAKTSNDVHEMQIINLEQFNFLMSFVDDYTFKAYFTFLFTTGVRRSEGIAILKADIMNNCVSINKSMKAFNKGFKTLKNASSKRIIPLDKYTIKVIQPLYQTKGEFLFGGIEPISCSAIQRHFKKALSMAQQQDRTFPNITIHSLRHSHASILISSNKIPITAISSRLGHSSTAITQEVYLHMFDKDSQKCVCVLDDLFEQK